MTRPRTPDNVWLRGTVKSFQIRAIRDPVSQITRIKYKIARMTQPRTLEGSPVVPRHASPINMEVRINIISGCS